MNLLGRASAAASDFVDVLRQVPTDAISIEADRPFRIAVAGAAGAGKSTLIGRLAGGTAGAVVEPFAARRLLELRAPLSPSAFQAALDSDLVLWVQDLTQPYDADDYRALRAQAKAFLEIGNKADRLIDVAEPAGGLVLISAESSDSVRRQLLPAVLEATPELALAFGRTFSVFRSAVAEQEMKRVARVNAEVAIVSAIPQASIILGPASAAADSIILTKNQAVMVLRLAAMFGLTIDRRRLGEMLSLIGAGLGWRTLARELVGFVPAGFGVVPKAVIAYTGTLAAGHAAMWYYETGRRMPERQLQLLRQSGLREAREFVQSLTNKLRRAG